MDDGNVADKRQVSRDAGGAFECEWDDGEYTVRWPDGRFISVFESGKVVEGDLASVVSHQVAAPELPGETKALVLKPLDWRETATSPDGTVTGWIGEGLFLVYRVHLFGKDYGVTLGYKGMAYDATPVFGRWRGLGSLDEVKRVCGSDYAVRMLAGMETKS